MMLEVVQNPMDQFSSVVFFKDILLLHEYEDYTDSLQDFLVVLFRILPSDTELFDVLIKPEWHLQLLSINPLFESES